MTQEVIGNAVFKVDGDFSDADISVRDFERRTGGRIGKLGKTLAKGLAGGAALGGAAIVGLGVKGVKAAADIESAMTEVRTLLPEMGDEAFGALTDDLLEFSRETGIATQDAIPALYQALSAGIPPENVFDFLRTSADLSKGGVTELTTAVDGLTSVVNAYGPDTISAAQASDQLFTAVKLGKTNADELSASLFNVIPTAASLGIGFDEVAASLAVMTAQGVPTAQATTQLRGLFVEASKSGSKLDEAIRELAGKGFGELIEEGADATQIIEDLRESTTDQEFRDLFGSVEAANAALALTGPNADTVKDAMNEMNKSAGATAKAAAVVEESFNDQLGVALNDLNISLAKAGQELLPVLAPIILGVIKAAGPLAEKIAPKLADAIEAIADVLPIVESGFETIGDVFDESIMPVFSELVDTLLPPLAQILQLVANRMQFMADVWGIIFQVLTPIVQAILPILLSLWERIAPVILDLITSILPPLVALFMRIMDTAMPIVEQVLPLLLELFEGVLNTIAPLVIQYLPPLIALFASIIATAMPLVEQILPPLVELFGSIISTVMPIVEQLLPVLIGLFSTLITTALPIIEQLLPVLIELFDGLFESAGPAGESLLPQLIDGFMGIINAVLPIIDTILPVLVELFNTLLPPIMALVGRLLPILIPFIHQVAGAFLEVVNILLPVILELLPPLLALWGELTVTFWEALLPVLGMLIETLLPMFAQLLADLLPILFPLLEVLVEVAGQLLMDLSPVLMELIPIIAGLIEILLPFLLLFIEMLLPIVIPIIRLLGETVGIVFAGIEVWLRGVTWVIENVFRPAMEAVLGWIEEYVLPIFELVASGISGIADFVGGIDIPGIEIPGFAEGGIVTRPTLGVIGEAGPEAVIPLDGSAGGVGSPVINIYGDIFDNDTLEERIREGLLHTSRRGF